MLKYDFGYIYWAELVVLQFLCIFYSVIVCSGLTKEQFLQTNLQLKGWVRI